MRPTPIFDTDIFGHVQDGSISQQDWRLLLAHRPGHGWRLSSVTTLELLAGVHDEVRPENFIQQRKQIEFAYQLLKGRIHEEPRFLICNEVLGRPLPPEVPRLPIEVLADYMTVVRRANSLEEILSNRVRVNRLVTRGKGQAGLAGFKPSALTNLASGPRRAWQKEVERNANEIYPRWREHFQETRKRLPAELRKEVATRLVSDTERVEYSESFLRWMGAPTEPGSVAEITKRLDAVLEFTIFVTREFLTRNYNLEKNKSDVYDQFQLYYLSMDRFIIVSEDKNLRTRTARSSQARRIMSFDEFLKTL
ncbi:MAG: hypothetical protein DMG35_11595 [Acidobacteria bacterium]|nr:MAG: hypothetical protein DMG35_11595 [Acidobacteriota bacterium]